MMLRVLYKRRATGFGLREALELGGAVPLHRREVGLQVGEGRLALRERLAQLEELYTTDEGGFLSSPPCRMN